MLPLESQAGFMNCQIIEKPSPQTLLPSTWKTSLLQHITPANTAVTIRTVSPCWISWSENEKSKSSQIIRSPAPTCYTQGLGPSSDLSLFSPKHWPFCWLHWHRSCTCPSHAVSKPAVAPFPAQVLQGSKVSYLFINANHISQCGASWALRSHGNNSDAFIWMGNFTNCRKILDIVHSWGQTQGLNKVLKPQ